MHKVSSFVELDENLTIFHVSYDGSQFIRKDASFYLQNLNKYCSLFKKKCFKLSLFIDGYIDSTENSVV